jgi:hypothetical protein
VRGRRLTAWAMTRPCRYYALTSFNYTSYIAIHSPAFCSLISRNMLEKLGISSYWYKPVQ